MEEKEKSLASEMLTELNKNNKRLFTALVTVIILCFLTIGGFVYYINQYEVVSEDVTEYTNTSDGGNAIINDDGDVLIGDSVSKN